MKSYIISTLFVLYSVFSWAQSGAKLPGIEPSLTFIPDVTFKGSSLKGWHPVGQPKWSAKDGELIGKAKSNESGWLVLDNSFQDVGLHALFKRTGNTETGILFRMEKTPAGTKGVFISIKDEVAPYQVTLNEQGKIINRERMRQAGGISYRMAPPKKEGGPEAQANNRRPPSSEPEVEKPIKRPNTELRPNDWNQIEVFLELNVMRTFLNDGGEIGGAVEGSKEGDNGISGYGPIALYVGGGEVHFKDVMWKDISVRETPKEESSPQFSVQRISDMYYSWGADAGDYNKDGHMDVVAGPYIYYGPGFTKHKEIFPAIAGGPSLEFRNNIVQDTYDFNKDGWPDVLSSTFSSTALYINPKGESRRWQSYNILPGVPQGEITAFVDLDKDGTPELVYSTRGVVQYAKPDPSDPTKPWKKFNVSENGYGMTHGIGTGDINGDGRLDVLNGNGWWEQPAALDSTKRWAYHPEAFGRFANRSIGTGGTLMAVYDANGDGLNDVVTTLNAHGFGLAWFEQRRDGNGKIAFTRHMLSDDYSEKSVGDVTFSQPHGTTFADIDGDGIQDFVLGKRHFTHLDNLFDPDSYGPPVLYWYKTVRNPKAPGGAEFVPQLIHNRSGAGSEVTAIDLNKDGAVDLITSTNRGTFIYWNKNKK